MGRVKEYAIEQETANEVLEDDFGDDDIFAGDDSDTEPEVDLYGPVDFDDVDAVLQRIFAIVEQYPTGGESAWFHYLNDWDRRFCLNLYDMWITTSKTPLSPKQIKKSKVILRKMITPAFGTRG